MRKTLAPCLLVTFQSIGFAAGFYYSSSPSLRHHAMALCPQNRCATTHRAQAFALRSAPSKSSDHTGNNHNSLSTKNRRMIDTHRRRSFHGPLGSVARRRVLSSPSTTKLRSSLGDCDSEEECEIIYDDDDVIATETATGQDGKDGQESVEAAGVLKSETVNSEVKGTEETNDLVREQGLEHQQKVLDDGYEKQDMVKWRDAEVIANDPASTDEKSRLLTIALVAREGLEHDFSKAAWLDNYKVPGQFVGIRLDGGTKEKEGGTGKVAGNLVAVSTEPTAVRQEGGNVQVLVSNEDSFRLKGDTRGPAEEAEGRTLAGLEPGEQVKISDFMGRGFSSLFVGWIGLQSALQEQRNIVIVAAGVRGMGSAKAVLDWPPIQAHAGIRTVSVYVEDDSPISAPFLRNVLKWRAAGIRVTHAFTSLATMPGVPTSLEEAIFASDGGLTAAVGGKPEEASFLVAGLGGKRAMELTDRLTDEGVDASRLLFNDFF